MKTNTAPLHPDTFYHIYNRGINRETLFKEERNYSFFLKKFDQYISPVADTYAYCLLVNHFHFLIKTKPAEALQLVRKEGKPLKHKDAAAPEWILGNQFAIFFRSYTLSINKAYERTGGLFEEPFRRAPIQTDAYLTNILCYIHYNPQKHGLVRDYKSYRHSSYRSLIGTLPTQLKRAEVIDWFGSPENFRAYHDDHIPGTGRMPQWYE